MSPNGVQERPILTITESVASVLRDAAKDHSIEDVVVRFAVVEDSGRLAHMVAIEQVPANGDAIFEQHGITIVVGVDQVPLLAGAHFDSHEVNGEQRLTALNPNIPPQ